MDHPLYGPVQNYLCISYKRTLWSLYPELSFPYLIVIYTHTHTHTHTHTYIYVPSVIKVAWWGLESQYTLQDIILLYGVRGEDS